MLEILGLVLPSIAKVLERLIPDVAARDAAMAEIQKKLLENAGQELQAMKDVMVADAQQDDKFTKRARPSVVYWSMGMTSLIIFLAPFGLAGEITQALMNVPEQLWTMMTVGIGAFGVSRGIEKGIAGLKGKK